MKRLCCTLVASVLTLLACQAQAAPTTHTLGHAYGTADSQTLALNDVAVPAGGALIWHEDSLTSRKLPSARSRNVDDTATGLVSSGAHGVAHMLAKSFGNAGVQGEGEGLTAVAHTAQSNNVSEPDVPGLIVAGAILLFCRHRANVRARKEG